MQAQARICPICIDDHSADRECTVAELKDTLETERARIAELERAVVWAVNHRAMQSAIGSAGLLEWSNDYGQFVKCCDGTTAGILAAVLEAMGGK
jgi:hypothetical protein